MTDDQKRRIDDHRPAIALKWDDANTPPARAPFARPNQWTILLTSAHHGLVGAYGHNFPHAAVDHVRVNVCDEAIAATLRERVRELETATLTNVRPGNPGADVTAAEAKLYRDLTGDALALGYDCIPAALAALRAHAGVKAARPTEDDIPASSPAAFARRYRALLEENRKLKSAAENPRAVGVAESTLNRICDLFGIGALARGESTILENVRNAIRREDCLSAVERTFFMVPAEPDEEYPDEDPGDECLLNWGEDPEQYVERFRAALATISNAAPQPGQPSAEDVRAAALEEAAALAVKLTAVPRDVLGPATAPMKDRARAGEKVAAAIRALIPAATPEAIATLQAPAADHNSEAANA